MSQTFDVMTRAVSNRPDHVLLFLASLDGVLAEYEDDPGRVQVTRDRLELLTRLQRSPGVVVAIISGRPVADLRSRIPLDDDAFYIGLHGLEIAGPRFAWTRTGTMDTYSDYMRDIADRLQDVVAGIPGARLEWKGPIIALHTREAASQDVVWSRFQLLGAAADLVNTGAVRALRGHHVLELLPNVGSSRAEALLAVRRCVEERHHRPVVTVYIGEDSVDDDALNALGDDGVAAVVGRRGHVPCHLQSPEDVDAFMKELIEDRHRRSESVS